MPLDQLENLVDQGQFPKESFELTEDEIQPA